jgi:hypothetical protein
MSMINFFKMSDNLLSESHFVASATPDTKRMRSQEDLKEQATKPDSPLNSIESHKVDSFVKAEEDLATRPVLCFEGVA